jgi:DNA-binding IclR family transcriptional regulator
MRNTDQTKIQSVGRALTILELLADEREMGVTELGRRLGVHKATASRMVATLGEHGLVERDPATDRYRLGVGLMRLAGTAAASLELVSGARPMLEELARQTGETVNLAVLDGDEVMNIDQITGTRSVVSTSWVGKRTPLHCTSNGKVLLAFMEEGERNRLLELPLDRRTKNTITDVSALRTDLARVRAEGYAFTIEEIEEGLNAAAAPVRDAGGNVVAAVSVAGPAFRLVPAELPRIARDTKETAGAISRRLGFIERRQSVGSE